jgi:DNA-binding CsgD family transcriptional regulator
MDRIYTTELREIAQLLAVLVRRGTLQSTVIQELGSVGMSPKRIAELLDTSSNTVNVALHHARKNKGKKKHEEE